MSFFFSLPSTIRIDPCLNYRHCLYMSTTRSMSVQDHDVVIDHCCKELYNFIKLWLIGQNILMDPYTWSSISLLHSMMPYIYISDIAVLYPSLDGVPWPLLLWIISHTGYMSLIIHLLGHGSRLHELMDYKHFGIWSRRMYKTSPLILTSRGSNSSSKLFCYARS